LQILVPPPLNRGLARRPTKRALDAGDSAAFSGIFLASSFFCSRTESSPAPTPVTQTVSPQHQGKIQ